MAFLPSLSSVLFLFLIWRVLLVIYRLFFHPLADFPGPKLAAITSLYEFYYDVCVPPGGQFVLKLKELHDQYGPVIRLTPTEVHILDPDFHSSVFSFQGRWEKHKKYQRFGQTLSLFATVDHDVHKRGRAALAPFFSKTNIKELEPRIQRKVDKFIHRLRQRAGSPKPLLMRTAYGAFAKDSVLEYCLDVQSNGALDDPTFDAAFMDLTRNMAPVFHISKQFTWLPWMFDSLPLNVIEKIEPAAAAQKRMINGLHKEIQTSMARIKEERRLGKEKSDYRTIFAEVIRSETLPEHEASAQRMTDELHSFTIAGTDTVAFALMVMTYHILKDDGRHLQKLRNEVSAVPRPWTLQQLERLPYLTGVVQEGLRLSVGAAFRTGRVAPDRAIVYPGSSALGCGSKPWLIPPGTEISMNTMHIHFDERIWGADVNEFKPERWYKLTERRRLSKYMVTFQGGTRGCLGMNLAYAEIYLILAHLFAAADIDLHLHNASDTDMDIVGDMIQPLVKKEVEVLIARKGEQACN